MEFITANALVAHAIGDYLLQSDWMAQRKTKEWLPAYAHALVYTLPFLFLTQSPAALLFICATHFYIDHYRLARFVVYAKNFLSPRTTIITNQPEVYLTQEWWHPWSECSGTGYHENRPVWMVVWLMIIADNVMHVLLNAVALRWL